MGGVLRSLFSLLLLFLGTGAGGCAESSWVIPYPAGEKGVDLPLPVRNSVGESTVLWLGRPWPYEVAWAETSDRAAVAVYVAGRGGLEGKGILPWLVVAVWRDGRVISSEDLVEGGRPYFRSQIDPESAAGLILTLREIAVKSGVPSTIRPGIPDYSKMVIQFRTVDGVYALGSGHELQEDEEWVTTDRGIIRVPDGQSPQKVLVANSSESYMRFRRVWAAMREVIGKVVPKKKEVVGEEIFRFDWAGGRE